MVTQRLNSKMCVSSSAAVQQSFPGALAAQKLGSESRAVVENENKILSV